MAGLDAIRSSKVSAPPTLAFSRFTSSVSALTLSKFWIDTLRRSGETGFTTKSSAPARMARITVSIEPCAVCTITGRWTDPDSSFSKNSSPSMPGIMRSRMMSSRLAA